ncbi:hypothetical protein B296_00034195 [Ensete ventricosum]|uniref:Uncharacterized protein n=1 Tax=Ensete ventricosum TaxID=4639 RepID=A0A426Y809_ENSVE|nr:hypothetical protein B296_00034195 [Ensete ventricosum]
MTDAVGIPVWDSVHGAPRGVSVRLAQWKDATLNPRRLRAPRPPRQLPFPLSSPGHRGLDHVGPTSFIGEVGR